jgi:toxin ParE1/3/4
VNKYRLSALAFQDLEEIADYIGERNPAAAVKVLDRLHESFRLLAESPLLGEKRDDLPGSPRVFSVGNYLIAYEPLPNGIQVGRVADARRDIVSLLRQR